MTGESRERKLFDEWTAQLEPGLDELDWAVWASLTERKSPRQLAETDFDDDALMREVAFTIWYAMGMAGNLLSEADKGLLRSTVYALVEPSALFRLTLKRSKAGRLPTEIEFRQRRERQRQVIAQIQSAIDDGQKLESAVAQASSDFELARSSIFSLWARKDEFSSLHAQADLVRGIYELMKPKTGLSRFWGRLKALRTK